MHELPEEAYGYTQLPADLFTGPPRRQLSATATLAELAADYVLFTPALLTSCAHFHVSPVQEWVNLQSTAPELAIIKLEQPLWSLGSPSPLGEEYRLDACPRAVWPSLLQHLVTIAILDRQAGIYSRALVHAVLVPDQRASVPSGGQRPMVGVSAVAISSNRGRYHWCLSKFGWLELATAAADPAVVREAALLLGTRQNGR